MAFSTRRRLRESRYGMRPLSRDVEHSDASQERESPSSRLYFLQIALTRSRAVGDFPGWPATPQDLLGHQVPLEPDRKRSSVIDRKLRSVRGQTVCRRGRRASGGVGVTTPRSPEWQGSPVSSEVQCHEPFQRNSSIRSCRAGGDVHSGFGFNVGNSSSISWHGVANDMPLPHTGTFQWMSGRLSVF